MAKRLLSLIALSALLLAGVVSSPVFGSDVGADPEILAGWFHTIFEDDLQNPGRSGRRFVLIDEEGQWTELSVPEAVLAGAGGSAALRGRRVRVVVAAGARRAPEVLSLAPLSEKPGRAGSGDRLQAKTGGQLATRAAVLGSQPYASLACKFKDLNQTPQNMNYIDGLMGSTYPGLDHYWREISSGRIDLTGSVQLGWYRLPGTLDVYYDATYNVLDIYQLLADCVAEADGDLYLPDFAGINVMVNDSLGGKALGGSATLTVDGVVKTYGVTWLSSGAWQTQKATAHEMGHSFGWPHSSGPYGQVYDSYWDVMSGGSAGTIDPDYALVGSGTISYHHDLAGWIDPLRKLVAPPDTSSTVTLERLDQPVDGNAYLMVEIAADADTTYTVEARKQVGYDAGIPAEGVVIHDVSYQAFVVDADGDGDPNDEGAVWVPGETFEDAANSVSVTVESDTGTGYVVTVDRGGQTPLPNLTVSQLSGPAVSAPGGRIHVFGVTENLGSAGTGSGFFTGIYLSEDGVITDDDWILANLGQSALGAGATVSLGNNYTIPEYLPTGTYTLGALADRGERINETDESDNSGSANILVVGYFAPTAATDPASGVTSTQVTLNGTVNPLGQETSAWFEWGTTTAYGSTSPVQNLAASSDDLAVSYTASGLTAGVTYHFRMAAQNPTGTTYGNDRTFVPSAADVDLVVTDVSAPPSAAALGTTITPSATVLNQGTASADVFQTGIYLAEDPLMAGPSTRCGGGKIYDGLLAGESRNRSFLCTIPVSLAPGTYYLVARADDYEEVEEVNEANNTLSGGTIEVTQADLAIAAVSGPATAAAAQTFGVSNTVENLGAGEATAFRVGIYLSADAVIDGGDALLGDRLVSSLDAGLSDPAVTDVTIPASTPTGSYFVGAMADHQDAVPETDEANNALVGNAIAVVNDLPDLIVTQINAPSSINSGSFLSGQVQVKNQGGSSTVIGGVIAMYLSEDTVIDGSDLYLGTLPFPELSANQIDTLSYRVGVPFDTPGGRYWVAAVVDFGDAITESDETNNTGTAPDRIRVK